MTIAAPVILLPTNGADYATDIAEQTISGTTSPDTQSIKVNGSSYGVSYTIGDTIWAWSGTILSGVNTLNIVATEKLTNISSLPVTINVTLVMSDQFITVAPPTGVKLREYQDKVEIVNTQNTETQTLGYNYYVSTQSGGINGKYVKINKSLVTDYSSYSDQAKLLNRTVDTAGNIRVTTITEEINRYYYYSEFFDETTFNNMVTAGLLPTTTFSEETSFFFVVSAQIYDPVLGQVTESSFSSELEGSPITITTGIKDLPGRTQTDIILTFSQELLTSNAGIDTKPGTVIRDMMDPISEEMARVYIIQNFLSRSLSVSGLLDFDDANVDGVSDPVSSSVPKSALKLALNLTNDYDVQRVINDQFDKLAANVNVIRRDATPAVGTVTFYVTNVPIRNMTINEGAQVISVGDLDQGIPSQSYRVMSTKTLEYQNRDQYYNPQTGRYEIEMDIQAVSSGEAGNTDAFTIRTISSGVDTDFLVENQSTVSFGQDQESNHDLATRIELAFFVDTGTEGGYARTAINVPGVRKVRVEKANDPLMIRDYDPIRKKHVGGKVDIYVQGRKTHQVTDQIAFAFGSVSGSEGTQSAETFLVLNAQSFQFKSQNPRVSAHTPIFEVTRIYNSTKAKEYDLTGYMVIGDGDTIDLDETRQINVAIGLASADVIKVDYKYRSSDTFVMSHQPVTSVVSVVGQISGTLPTENYELVTLQDTLSEGSSTIATDGVRIIFVNNLPLSEFQTIVDEQHVLILEKEEPLNFLGADPESIVVKNTDKTITYVENVDYRIIPGTDIVATAILIMETGGIDNGQRVLISYTAIENFIITYTTNELLSEIQTDVDRMKHACADVIIKQAVENKVDFALTIIPKTGVTNTNLLSTKIGTALGNYVTQLGIGNALTQSAVVHVIQAIADVDYVVVPFARMTKADGSFIVRDHIGLTQFEIFNEGLARAYISSVPILSYKTIDMGGPDNKFRGIFENTMPLILQSDPLDVSGGPGRGYIREDGKVVVSTIDGALPDSKSYEVAYYVYGETGSKDINVASIENLVVGTLTIVYDQPRESMQTL